MTTRLMPATTQLIDKPALDAGRLPGFAAEEHNC